VGDDLGRLWIWAIINWKCDTRYFAYHVPTEKSNRIKIPRELKHLSNEWKKNQSR